MPKRASSKQKDVSADDTPTKEKPRLLSLEAVKERARHAASPEGRREIAKPFPLTTLDCEVLVAPAAGDEFYEMLFQRGREFFEDRNAEINVDRGFIKSVILNCVIEPKLDEEVLDLILEANASEFATLANFCMTMTLADTPMKIGDRLGALDTEAQELLFASVRGSLSTGMRV